MRQRVFIDTDIALGCQNADVDDAVALLLALAEPSLSVIGISPSSGNVPGKKSGPCLDSLLKRIGRDGIPHASFPSALWDTSKWVADTRWAKQPPETFPAVFGNGMQAAEFMARTILREVNPVTVITIGPLTNLATSLVAYPNLKDHIAQLVMMGGTWKMPGYAGQTKEFNILCDPEAASYVMNSGIPVMMFGLDVTKKRKIVPTDLEAWLHSGSFLHDIGERCSAFMHYRAKRDGYNIPYAFFHDVMPIAFLVHHQWFAMKPCDIQVAADGEFTRGMTIVDFKKRQRACLKDQIAVDVDSDAVFSYVRDTFLRVYGKIQDA